MAGRHALRILLAVGAAVWAATAAGSGAASESAPAGAAPELRAAWLRFHELELCQALDTVFVFEPRAVEVWCVLEDEKSHQKLLELLEPLRASFGVTVYTTRPTPEKKTPEDRDPPPSLWNNAEIREYLQDPFARAGGAGASPVRITPKNEGTDPDFFLKQRMVMFAEQTLDWGKKMKRYAADLPELAAVGFGSPGATADIRARAIAVALAHSQGVDRYAEKLADNVSRALPKATRRFRPREEPETAPIKLPPPVDGASQVAAAARSIARRVYRFIHPMNHTVGLVDLREPSLLDSLKTLRHMAGDYQRSAAHPPPSR